MENFDNFHKHHKIYIVYIKTKRIKYSGEINTHLNNAIIEIDRLSFSPFPRYFAKSLSINQTKDKRCVEISQIIY